MPKKDAKNPADYIAPLYMNGLHGRMMHLPAPAKKKRQILLIYGHHASLERMFGLAEELNRYGSVTMPDLPGFGGMESFYKIGEKPTLDSMADYLAAFVKLRYKRRRVTIMAMSFGFLVATRMLQRYPELAEKVDLLVSMVGFAHHEDFKIKKRNHVLLKIAGFIGSRKLPAIFIKYFVFRGPFIRLVYRLTGDKNAKFKDTKPEEWRKQVNFEVNLWKINDVRTRCFTGYTLLTVNLCNERVNVPVTHVCIDNDRYFDNHLVEQHLKVIFDKVTMMQMEMHGHAPTVVADAAAAAPFIPTALRRQLARS